MTNPREWNGHTPPDYLAVYKWRAEKITQLRVEAKLAKAQNRAPRLLPSALAYYAAKPEDFINHWCDTTDPRNATDPSKLATMPMVLFPRQIEFVRFMHELVTEGANGLVEKSRDMGATWVACAFSVWAWRFLPGAAIGWGSRLSALVDRLGDPASIFEKMRQIIMGLPREFWPKGFRPDIHMTSMRILNPENGASIIGETGDNIGRGGRTLAYFVDEAAHLEHPEMVEAALGNNTNVRIDISSVNGLGNVFHRKREAGVDWQPGAGVVKNRYNVFVMDWADNPLHTQEWYDNKREEKESAGLLHVFMQEVERNYSAAVSGLIIPATFVAACVDAHLVIPDMEDGPWVGSLDPADEGGDLNAAGARKGVVLRYADQWGEGDTGQTTRRAAGKFASMGRMDVQYDSVGVGAGVKSEVNRLSALPTDDPERMPDGLRWIGWNAGAGVLLPDEHIDPTDDNSRLNKEQYANLKAQAWWAMRTRAEKTMKAVAAVKAGLPSPYDPTELCSFDSATIPQSIMLTLRKELSQPVRKKDIVSTKFTVDKKPPGTKSPNLADMIVMNYFPIPIDGYDWSAFD